MQLVPFLLPHELIYCFLHHGADIEKLLSVSYMGEESKANLERAKAELGVERLIGLGLWGDGAPCNWDRTKSLEVLALSFPGLEDNHNLRLPIVTIMKHHVVKTETYEDIGAVVSWSMRFLALGVCPSRRHDGRLWVKRHDHYRAKIAAKGIGAKAVFVEIRGDWMFYKQVFKLPQQNELTGICWMCTMTPGRMCEVGEHAFWRHERLTHWDVIARMHLRGEAASSLMNCPCVRTTVFRVDWLHAVDQGVAADFMGNALWSLLDRMYTHGSLSKAV